ncbi:kinase-like domain-containing protein [Aspergillus recurvatus]
MQGIGVWIFSNFKFLDLPSRGLNIYHPQPDVKDLESYTPGGYHPTSIGDSLVWLARDRQLARYVALKTLVADKSQDSREGTILELLANGDIKHGRRCLVGEPAGCSITESKENSTNSMFPLDAARSLAAQLAMGLSICMRMEYLHAHNFLLRLPNLDSFSTAHMSALANHISFLPRGVDGKPSTPHAPPRVTYPIFRNMPANEQENPEVNIADYGTSSIVSQMPSPTLHMPTLYCLPEDFVGEPITTTADVWTLGVALYELLGERRLFETFTRAQEDIIGEMVNVLGKPPARWWNCWANRPDINPGTIDFACLNRPESRRLHPRIWWMGRGETPESCGWDVAGGEFKALEDMLRAMLSFEPKERPTPKQLLQMGSAGVGETTSADSIRS